MHIEDRAQLAPFTTFHIGGPARFFARAKTLEEVREAIIFANTNKVGLLCIGEGSNLLVDDKGYGGLALKVELEGLDWLEQGSEVMVVAAAGEHWDGVVEKAVEKGLWGIENLSGIPGTAGAAPVQNIGAYGTELKDVFRWAEALDTHTGKVERFDARRASFGYRTSFFKRESGRWCVLRVALGLSKKGAANVSYKDLAEAFKENPKPGIAQVRNAVLEIRSKKFPNYAVEGTAGSFFLNPVVSREKAKELAEKYPELPQFQTLDGVKLSLAWLLDKGLSLKGFSVGKARLFEKQPLVVVAEKGASSSDVIALKSAIIEKVKSNFGIELEPEVRIIS